MKHLQISISILLALFLFCCLSCHLVRTYASQTATLLCEASTLHDDEKADAYRAASDYWHAHLGLLDSFLRHDEADQVVEQLAQLQAYQFYGEEPEAASICASLVCRLQHIAEMELPLYFNLLTFLPKSYSVLA